jgi:hypothetical protein
MVLNSQTHFQLDANTISSAHSLTKKPHDTEAPTLTVLGKAFFDFRHAPKDQLNRRSHLPGYAAYEIHPKMALHVVQ